MFGYLLGGTLIVAGILKLSCHAHSHHKWMLRCALRRLRASEAQRQRINTLVDDAYARLRPIKEQLGLVHRELADILSADVLDPVKLEKLEARVFERIGEGTQVGREFVAKLHETLTPEQRVKMAAWLRSSDCHGRCCRGKCHA